VGKGKKYREAVNGYVDSKSRIKDAYKMVRANLLFTLANSKEKSVIITSAEPNAGKSTTASNLAISMAQTGVKVVLVDADMRKPAQHKTFRAPNNKGLSVLLGGLGELDSVIHHDIVENLDLITSGPIPPNPSELLGSAKMMTLLKQLTEMYDYVFIDTPPVNVVADSLMISDIVAGTLVVARQKQTRYEELKKAVDSVARLESRILGIVITDVNWKRKIYGNYAGYDKNYGSYSAEDDVE